MNHFNKSYFKNHGIDVTIANMHCVTCKAKGQRLLICVWRLYHSSQPVLLL